MASASSKGFSKSCRTTIALPLPRLDLREAILSDLPAFFLEGEELWDFDRYCHFLLLRFLSCGASMVC